MSQSKPSTSMTHVVSEFQATFSSEVIHAPMPRKLGGNRACSRVLCPGCPRLMQKLNVRTVHVKSIVFSLCSVYCSLSRIYGWISCGNYKPGKKSVTWATSKSTTINSYVTSCLITWPCTSCLRREVT